MNPFRLVAEQRTRRWIATQAEQIAQHRLAAFRDLIAPRLATMSPSEARGYVRAKATPIVHPAAIEAVRAADQSPTVVESLTAAAAARLFELALGESSRRSVRRAA